MHETNVILCEICRKLEGWDTTRIHVYGREPIENVTLTSAKCLHKKSFMNLYFDTKTLNITCISQHTFI